MSKYITVSAHGFARAERDYTHMALNRLISRAWTRHHCSYHLVPLLWGRLERGHERKMARQDRAMGACMWVVYKWYREADDFS